jgi:anti-sigma28 factor (negative regulator of flagellin synthesis)
MKISDPNGRAIPVGPSQASALGASKERSGSSTAAAGDQVRISGLSALMTAGKCDPGAQSAKLSSLAATVSSGKYHVDAGLVSNSIIEESLRSSGGYAA